MDFQLSLQSETIRSVYPEGPVAVQPETPVLEVVSLMRAQRVGAVLVIDEETLVGVFTERDVLKLLSDAADLSGPIRDVMSAKPVTVTEESTVGEAIQRMAAGGHRHLPIVGATTPDQAVGMVDVRGVMRYLVEHFPNTIYNLPPHPERATAEREGA